MECQKYFAIKKIHPAVFAALIMSMLFCNTANAQETMVEEHPEEMKVKYIEGDNDVLYFNLKYNNESGNDFKLMVLSETGDVLFQNNYSGKRFKKNLKLPRLTDARNVTFLIKPVQKNIHLSYKVIINDKVEDKTALARK
jgi:hypothetical protein